MIAPDFLRAHPSVLLAASTLVLVPFGRLVEGPVLLMAALGLWQLVRRPRETLAPGGARVLSAVFLCVWIPMLASLPDAVSTERTAIVVANHLRFWLSGLFLVHALADAADRRLFLKLAGAIIAFWIADALVQYFIGRDLFGFEAWPGRLGALFGPGNSKFGLTLAVMAPLLWHVAARHLGPGAVSIALALTVVVVFLAGSRAGWIAVLVAASTWTLLRLATTRARMVRASIVITLAVGLGCVAAYGLTSTVRDGIDEARAALDDDADPYNSIVHRIWIWGAAFRMIQAHPLNGVGARGFRNAFDDFARADDPYLKMKPPQRPTHSHQLLIEVAAETGSIGIVGLLLMAMLLVRAFRRAPANARQALSAMAAGLAAALFPLNTHLAIYSAYWSQIVWFLIGLYCAYAAAAGSPSEDKSRTSDLRTLSAENQRS